MSWAAGHCLEGTFIYITIITLSPKTPMRISLTQRISPKAPMEGLYSETVADPSLALPCPIPTGSTREGDWLTKLMSNATLLQVRLLSAQVSLPRSPSPMLLAQQGPRIPLPMASQVSLTLHTTGTVQTQLSTAGKAELNHSTAVHTFCSLRTFWMKKR